MAPGVFYLFRYLATTYPECLLSLKFKNKASSLVDNCESVSKYNIDIDWLEIDLNAGLHSVAQQIYTPSKSLLLKNKQPPPTKQFYFQSVCKYIDGLFHISSPRKGIHIAIDGIAGCSKQTQQRKRRFKSANGHSLPGFDSTVLSAGTEFMEELSEFLINYIENRMENKWRNLKVIFSDHKVVGEGEMKLLHHMRTIPTDRILAVSPDADVIFLSFSTHNPNIYIFRQNIFDDFDADFFLVNIKQLCDHLLLEAGLEKNADNILKMRAMEDLILLCMFMGNDFIPRIPSFDPGQGVSEILNIYTKIFPRSESLDSSCYKNLVIKNDSGEYTIDNNNFRKILHELSSTEEESFLRTMRVAKFPDSIYTELVKKGNFSFSNYKKEFYKKKFGDIPLEWIMNEYLRGMVFVLRYYLNIIPSYDWTYPYAYAPFFSDLEEYILNFLPQKFDKGIPFSPLEQLIAILPVKSAHLLPLPLRELLTSPDSPIVDMFPVKFEGDLEGKKNDYEEVILLCPICPKRIREAFKDKEHELEERDFNRNQPGQIYKYYCDKNGDIIQESYD